MTVIKKNGQHEAFNAAKLSLSAVTSAKEQGIVMSEKEGDLIAQDVLKMVRGFRGNDGLTSVYELRTLLGHALRQFGYKKVAKQYLCSSIE